MGWCKGHGAIHFRVGDNQIHCRDVKKVCLPLPPVCLPQAPLAPRSSLLRLGPITGSVEDAHINGAEKAKCSGRLPLNSASGQVIHIISVLTYRLQFSIILPHLVANPSPHIHLHPPCDSTPRLAGPRHPLRGRHHDHH